MNGLLWKKTKEVCIGCYIMLIMFGVRQGFYTALWAQSIFYLCPFLHKGQNSYHVFRGCTKCYLSVTLRQVIPHIIL